MLRAGRSRTRAGSTWLGYQGLPSGCRTGPVRERTRDLEGVRWVLTRLVELPSFRSWHASALAARSEIVSCTVSSLPAAWRAGLYIWLEVQSADVKVDPALWSVLVTLGWKSVFLCTRFLVNFSATSGSNDTKLGPTGPSSLASHYPPLAGGCPQPPDSSFRVSQLCLLTFLKSLTLLPASTCHCPLQR